MSTEIYAMCREIYHCYNDSFILSVLNELHWLFIIISAITHLVINST